VELRWRDHRDDRPVTCLEALDIVRKDGRTICANAHVQDIGWQGARCGTSVSVGTTGRSLRMEAIWITVP
jgi:uncharacterized protein YjdB